MQVGLGGGEGLFGHHRKKVKTGAIAMHGNLGFQEQYSVQSLAKGFFKVKTEANFLNALSPSRTPRK